MGTKRAENKISLVTLLKYVIEEKQLGGFHANETTHQNKQNKGTILNTLF